MNTHLHPVVLEARFARLAMALMHGEGVPTPTLAGVREHARLALRGLNPVVNEHGSESLGRAASRLARSLLVARRAVLASDQGILRLGVEMGWHLDALDVASTVRRVRDGTSQWPAPSVVGGEAAVAQVRLFIQIALVAVLTRQRAP